MIFMVSTYRKMFGKGKPKAPAPVSAPPTTPPPTTPPTTPPVAPATTNTGSRIVVTPSNVSQPVTNKNEWKPSVALLVIFLYILLAYFWIGFSFKGAFIIITGLITLLSIEFDKPTEELHKLAIFVIWLALAILLFVNVLPDYNSQIYFLMLSASMAALMDQKTAIIFFGVAILSMLTFQDSIIGFIVMIVVFLFIYSASESIGLGLIMMVPLLMVGWLVGSGYGAFISQKVDGLSTQFSATTGISTEGIGDKIAFMFNDTWLLMTNPNAWYEKQNAVQGTQTDGSLALEITKIEALPSAVIAKDNFDVVFEFENKGQKAAENVIIGATAETLADACGKMEGKFCNPICVAEGTAPASCGMNRTIEKVSPQEKRFESVNFQAPECPGTYSTEAVLKYEYTVDATLNLQMISRNYYEDLLRNKKLTTAPELSEASAGPFKLTLKTSRDQPIPDTETDSGVTQKFKIYVGMVNQRAGKANLSFALLKIPKKLMLVGWDTANNQVDEGCSITYGVPDPANGLYLSDIVKDSIDTKKPLDYTTYTDLEKYYRGLAETGNDYITYKTVDYNTNNRILKQNEWRYYKCNFRLVDGEKIDQIQTLFLQAELPYIYTITKKTTVSVRSESLIPARCKKNVETLSAINIGQTKPQTTESILDDLAYRIYYCYNQKGNRLIAANEPCGDYKVDIAGCTGAIITAQNIYDRLATNPKYPYYKDALSRNIYFDTEMDKNLFFLTGSGTSYENETTKSDTAFHDNYIYRINIFYHAPTIPDARSGLLGFNYMTIKYSAIPVKDTAECA